MFRRAADIDAMVRDVDVQDFGSLGAMLADGITSFEFQEARLGHRLLRATSTPAGIEQLAECQYFF